MRQPIEQTHNIDGAGNPAGGTTRSVGIAIDWQNGPLAVDGVRKEPNGALRWLDQQGLLADDGPDLYRAEALRCAAVWRAGIDSRPAPDVHDPAVVVKTARAFEAYLRGDQAGE